MFKKQYNNNFLFIALIIILFTVIAVFAYLIMKANSGKQNSADTAGNSSAENLRVGSDSEFAPDEINPPGFENLPDPNPDATEEPSLVGSDSEIAPDEINPPGFENLPDPVE